ncbi:MAG TPA: hypothetical protein VFP93_01785, partial [Gammaproteobacteria bacterium]|nr:hypothetical protein [Gammaproteobacteria bacterium]
AEIAQIANQHDIIPIFTIIPTKETVYYDKLIQMRVKLPDDFHQLVTLEKKYIKAFGNSVKQLPSTLYIDLLTSLQEALSLNGHLYPQNENGHPLSKGYDVIAQALHQSLPTLPSKNIAGPVAIPVQNNIFHLYLIKDNKLWLIPKHKDLETNGIDLTEVTILKPRDIAHLQHAGSLFD